MGHGGGAVAARRFACILAAVTVMIGGGCADEKATSADRDTTTTTRVDLTTARAPVELSTTQTTSVLAGCLMERRTTRTANAAQNAVHGEYAATIDDLVGEFLRRAPKYWTIVPGKAEPVPRPGTDLPAGCS